MGRWEQSPREEKSVRRDQSVSQMAQEVLMRQAKVLAQRSGYSLEEASQTISDTEAGRQLRELANGEHRYVKAGHWQASVFWERAEERFMHQIGSEALSRYVAERHSTRG
jgi:type II secretory pathway component PulF